MELLERHFDTAFDAPDGIKKLRELILTLAMQGKLVPQNPNDPPASELLKEIKAEERRLIKEGKVKEPKPLPPVTPEEVPYALPKGWQWVRLGNMGSTNIGLTYSPSDVSESGIPVLRSNNIQSGMLDLSNLKRVAVQLKQSVLVQEGDLLICARNGSRALVGKTAMIPALPEAMAFGAFMAIFRSKINPFLLRFINSPLFREMIDEVNTVTINQITQDNLRSTAFPLPPLSEQSRIVGKIDELMARCDELEKLRAERDTKRLAAHTAAVRQLLNVADTDGHIQAREFLGKHFGELYTVKENVTELRKAILQLAVMGKLVPQDPKDAHASEVIQRIQGKKSISSNTRIGRASSSAETAYASDNAPFNIPDSWQWTRIADLSESIVYGTSHKTCDDSSLVAVYRMGNIVNGKLINDGFKYISPDVDDLPQLFLRDGDILFNRTNSYELVGKSAIYSGPDNHATLASYLIRIRLYKQHVSAAFINMAMNAPYFRQTQIEPEIIQQCGQANFNGTKLSLCAIPLPPLAEQHRIVAKTDQLMSMCDTLERQIDAARETQSAMLNAMMAHYGGQRCA